jgi:hypothetical protein
MPDLRSGSGGLQLSPAREPLQQQPISLDSEISASAMGNDRPVCRDQRWRIDL